MANTTTQLNDVRFRYLEQTIEAERNLRQSAESRTAEAIRTLYDIAAAYCSEALDAELRERKTVTQSWTARQWGEFIHRHLGPRIKRADAGDQLGRQFESAQKQAETLQGEVAELKKSLAQQEARAQALERELSTARTSLQSAMRRVQEELPKSIPVPANEAAPGVRVVRTPGEWFDKWQAERGFERSRDLVQLLGETGWCRRTAVWIKLNQQWNVAISTKRALSEAIELSVKYELIEIQTVEQAQGQPQVIRLSERGMEAFLLLFNRDPVPSELDELLKRHKTLEHTLLNLEAADALRERLRATMDLYPPTVVLDGGRKFMPDLMAALPEGDVIYVECERDVSKNPDDRDRKWRNVYDATGGRFYIICPDVKSRKKIESEINVWLVNAGLPGVLSATDLATLAEQKDGRFWATRQNKK